jgi:hypothetical protein
MAGARGGPGRPAGPRGPGSPFGPGGPWGPTDPRGPAGPWGPGGPEVDATCCILDSWLRLSTTMCAKPAMAATVTAMKPINHLCIALPLTWSESARAFLHLFGIFLGDTHRSPTLGCRVHDLRDRLGAPRPAGGQSGASDGRRRGQLFANSDAVELCARSPTRSRTSGRVERRVGSVSTHHRTKEVPSRRVRPACGRIIHVLDLRLPGRGGIRADHPNLRRPRPGSV